MQPVLLATHLDDHDSGFVRDTLERAGCAVLEWNPLDEPGTPPPTDVAGIVSLGGRQSAIDAHHDPGLAAEVDLMRAALADRVPVLGMCLGAQLLAVAGGGRVSRLGAQYVGWPEYSPLPGAATDPLFAGLTPGLRVLKWHEDVIDPPDGAVVLGTTDSPGVALFRLGPAAWGSQAHLEVTPPMLLDGWLADAGADEEIEAAGHEMERFRADSRRNVELQMAAARPAVASFAELVLSSARART